MLEDPKCFYSSTLIVSGDSLDPKIVTERLGIEPSQSWRRGERPSFVRPDGSIQYLNMPYEWGGWKRSIEDEKKTLDLSAQLEYWCDFLSSRVAAIRELKASGYWVVIDCFITTGETTLVRIASDLQQRLANLGIDLDLNFYAYESPGTKEKESKSNY